MATSTSWPRPVRSRSLQRGDDAECGERGRGMVGDRRARAQRRPVGEAGAGHEAGSGLHDVVHRGPIGVGPALAVAGDRRIHEAPVGAREIAVPQAEAVHRTRAGVLDEHVGAFGERGDQAAAVGVGDVDTQAALAACSLQERHRDRAVHRIGGRAAAGSARGGSRRLAVGTGDSIASTSAPSDAR